MSSSLLDFSLNENAVSFRCIALRKTSDLYKSCVEYFLLKISVICSPVFLFFFFFKRRLSYWCVCTRIFYICVNANSREEVGVLQCVQCMSNGDWCARMFKCNITLSGERELWSVLMLWRLCFGFVAQRRVAQAVTQVNTDSRKTCALTSWNVRKKKSNMRFLLPKGRVTYLQPLTEI